MRPIRCRGMIAAAAMPALLLTACASEGRFVDRDGWTNYAALEEAESDCSSFWSVLAIVLTVGAYGAAEGAAVGSPSNHTGEGAAYGAGVGAGIGLLAGLASIDDSYRRCMARKGYIQVAAPSAE